MDEAEGLQLCVWVPNLIVYIDAIINCNKFRLHFLKCLWLVAATHHYHRNQSHQISSHVNDDGEDVVVVLFLIITCD